MGNSGLDRRIDGNTEIFTGYVNGKRVVARRKNRGDIVIDTKNSGDLTSNDLAKLAQLVGDFN